MRLSREVLQRDPPGALGDEGDILRRDLDPADDEQPTGCLLYTSDAADERSSVDLGGRRIIKKNKTQHSEVQTEQYSTYSK